MPNGVCFVERTDDTNNLKKQSKRVQVLGIEPTMHTNIQPQLNITKPKIAKNSVCRDTEKSTEAPHAKVCMPRKVLPRHRPLELRLDPLDVVRAERGDKSDKERLRKQRNRIRQREIEIMEWDALDARATDTDDVASFDGDDDDACDDHACDDHACDPRYVPLVVRSPIIERS